MNLHVKSQYQIMKIEKPKKPKHLSDVLKTSLLERVLREADVKIDTHLIYWILESGGSILEAFYWVPNENVSYPRLYMRAGVVPNKEHKKTFELLQNEALPAFAEWLTLPSRHAGSGIAYDVYDLPNNTSIHIAWIKGKTAWAFIRKSNAS